jgi:hypothetical protein
MPTIRPNGLQQSNTHNGIPRPYGVFGSYPDFQVHDELDECVALNSTIEVETSE